MLRFEFSTPDPSAAIITESATGTALYCCSHGKSSRAFSLRHATGETIAEFDDSLLASKVMLRGRRYDLKELMPRKSILSEYVQVGEIKTS